MKKENLIAQLEGAKALSSQVDIDKVIELLNQLEAEVKEIKVIGITQDLAESIASRIERALDFNSDDLVDRDSAEFEINYDNRIELSGCQINVYDTMSHVTACIDEFVVEEEDEAEEADEEESEE
jgi:hypothetical protein